MKAISVCGFHHTGKTGVCEALISGLVKRGERVASIKDIHYEKFSMEKPGSNSDRHYQAGAEPVFARGIDETDLIWRRQLTFNEMITHIDADWLIVEGMHELAMPRIICGATTDDLEKLNDSTVFAVSGKYADEHDIYGELPVISALNEPERLVDLVLARGFAVLPQVDPECCSHCGMSCHEFVGAVLRGERQRAECVAENLGKVRVWQDEQEMKLVPFVQNILHDSIEALLKNLKGYKTGRIRIEYDNSRD
ncbi:MAG: molybdopterin-guanine dinucleotide biosynthesis protein MobB [Candidatus Cloacimonetes bacterium]|nr:molybdopterin-guanine dinucleotide biosynthesis protein MobB [Candidatus Cloacimonadota bacterium]